MPKQPKPKRGRPFIGKRKTTIRLSPKIIDALSQESQRSHRPKSDIAEQAIAQFLKLKNLP